jgi:hypothetical protein
MIDPAIQFRDALSDSPEVAASRAAEQAAQVEQLAAAWEYLKEVWRAAYDAIVAALQLLVDFIIEVFDQIEVLITTCRRRLLYYRLSERLPGWLARWLARRWPKRYLPVLRW